MFSQFSKRWMAVLSLGALAVILSACAAASPTDSGIEEPENGADGGDSDLQATIDGLQEAGGESVGYATQVAGQAEATEAAAEYAPIDADEERANSSDGSTGGGVGGANTGESPPVGFPQPTPIPANPVPPINVPPDSQLQPLQAGEINDNEDFEAFLQYQLDYKSFVGWPIHDIDVSERYTIRVIGSNSRPVLGADVTIYAGQNAVTTLHTPATGLVYFFPRAYQNTGSADEFVVTVQRDQTQETFSIERGDNAFYEVTLDVGASQPPVDLDVLFLIDSTGSMGDEIDELKNNILSISAQVAALPSQPDVRFGMVTYRDHGDSYVVKTSDFTRDVSDFQQELMQVFAAGGGDDPEALQEALAHALHSVEWRGGETVQLIFLVADAPPHLDYSQDYPYSQSLLEAAQMGIKIQPIASRLCETGRDSCSAERRAFSDQAEYIFRQMAQFTGGSFIFLTYEDTPQNSGEPGSDTHVDEQSFSVQDLDSLVIRLITEELDALNGGQ